MSRLGLSVALLVMLPTFTAFGQRAASIEAPQAAIREDPTRGSRVDRSPALATDSEQYPDPCATMPDLCEAYDNGGTGGGTSGGNYSYCYADRRTNQKCQDKVTYYTTSGACVTGCAACASVMYSAKCYCNVSTLATSGICKYN